VTNVKSALKIVANLLAAVVAAPLAIAYFAVAAAVGTNRVFPGMSQFVSLGPGVAGAYVRRAFYRMVLPECGSDSFIGFGTILSHSTACIGRGVYVGSYCILGDVTLEDDVLLGSHVSIINGNRQHGIDRSDMPVRDQPGTYPRVTIGRDTWIGDRAVVMFDVGRHAVAGAGSVVTTAVEDFAIVAGNPARVIGSRGKLAASHAAPCAATKSAATTTIPLSDRPVDAINRSSASVCEGRSMMGSEAESAQR
jgi:acetyltransferase-like isoleucine patch superfamily enzyme